MPGLNRRASLTYVEQTSRSNTRNGGARSWNANAAVVTELARLLLANPAGLRRWSVMRAMRKVWQASQQEVSLKFEDEVERHFRYFSANDDCARSPGRAGEALFFRPSEKAGEVWAADPERVRAWLMTHAPEQDWVREAL